MAARPTPAVGTTYLGNVNLSLRCISVWIDDKKGGSVEVDQPIIGWAMSPSLPPTPIVYGGIPKEAQFVVVRDNEQKCWTDAEGNTYLKWADVVAPLWAAYDLRKAREELQKAKDKPASPLRAPGVQLGPVPGDHSGPQAWKEPQQ